MDNGTRDIDDLKKIIRDEYLAELFFLDNESREQFLKRTVHIERLGVAYFWAADRFDDIFGANENSGISMKPFLKMLQSVAVRVETIIAMREALNPGYIRRGAVFEAFQESITSWLRTVGYECNTTGTPVRMPASSLARCILPDALMQYSQLSSILEEPLQKFYEANLWCVYYYLFLASGGFRDIFSEIEKAQSKTGD
jgi:hypothetical protein